MNCCKPWPLFFALAVGSQMPPRFRKAVLQEKYSDWKRQLPITPDKLEDVYKEATNINGGAQVDERQLPRNPQPAPDISYGDAMETVDHAAVVTSEELKGRFGLHGKDFPQPSFGTTCQEVCLTCMQLNMRMFPNCECRAQCTHGGRGDDVCESDFSGWSKESPTIPSEFWRGECETGQVSCSDCLSEQLIAENEQCHNDPVCMLRVRDRIKTKVGNERYCTNSGMRVSSCERFTYEPKENGWVCYTTLQQCEAGAVHKEYEDSLEFEAPGPNGELVAHCLWCDVSTHPDLSKPAALQVAVEDVNVTTST